MPRVKTERQNARNKVSIEYPAKILVNGRVIADEFPDWHYTLGQDRCKLTNGETFVEQSQQQQRSIIAWKALGRDCTNNNGLILQIGV